MRSIFKAGVVGMLILSPLALTAFTLPAAAAPGTDASATAAAEQHATGTHHLQPDQVEIRIASLHKKLMITAAEEGPWNGFAQALRDNAADMRRLAAARQQNEAGASALDNLKSYQQIAQAHADGVQKMITAFQPLYDALSPQQKAVADTLFRHHGHNATTRS